MATLDQLKIGKSAVITSVNGVGALRRRLLDMGLTPRTMVHVRKVAPMGDPIELNLRGYELTLRAEDAANIEIEPIGLDACYGCCPGCSKGRKGERGAHPHGHGRELNREHGRGKWFRRG